MVVTLILVALAVAIISLWVGTTIPRDDKIAPWIKKLAKRLNSNSEVETSSIRTLKSLGVGICLTIGLSALVYAIISIIIESLIPSRFYGGMWIFNPMGALSASVLLGAWLFSTETRFTIKPSEIGFAKVLGIPISGAFGVGTGWLPPKIAEMATESQAGIERSSVPQENITKDGFTITWKGSFLLRVCNALLAQKVKPEEREKLGMNEFLEAGRNFLANEEAGVHEAHKVEITSDEARDLLAKIAQFKIRTNQDGRKWILENANNKLQAYGLELAEVQITEVKFSLPVEEAADRILSETLQRAGLKKDAENKKVVVEVLMSMYKDQVDFSKFSDELKAELIDRMADRALAIEDKAKVTRINFGGTPPSGTFVNLGNPQGGN